MFLVKVLSLVAASSAIAVLLLALNNSVAPSKYDEFQFSSTPCGEVKQVLYATMSPKRDAESIKFELPRAYWETLRNLAETTDAVGTPDSDFKSPLMITGLLMVRYDTNPTNFVGVVVDLDGNERDVSMGTSFDYLAHTTVYSLSCLASKSTCAAEFLGNEAQLFPAALGEVRNIACM